MTALDRSGGSPTPAAGNTSGSTPALHVTDLRAGATIAFGRMPTSDAFLDRTAAWAENVLVTADDPLVLLCAGWAMRSVTLAREVRELRAVGGDAA